MPVLIITLDDEYEDVKATAGWTLGLIGKSAKEAVPMLIDALGDERAHRLVRGGGGHWRKARRISPQMALVLSFSGVNG